MQNAKDTFYIALRDRLAAMNPSRTTVVRGVMRPGVMVEENELASANPMTDVFSFRWTETNVNAHGALPLIKMRCEIEYATGGNTGNGGMDRGRLLAGMDAELAAIVNAAPQNAVKVNYQGAAGNSGPTPVAMGTKVFWGDVMFGAAVVNGERLQRVATVDVFSYQEEGEL
jgi:hypothetical protein